MKASAFLRNHPRPFLTGVVGFVALCLLAGLALVRARTLPARYECLSEGMTEEDVQQTMGSPGQSEVPKIPDVCFTLNAHMVAHGRHRHPTIPVAAYRYWHNDTVIVEIGFDGSGRLIAKNYLELEWLNRPPFWQTVRSWVRLL